MTDRTAMKFYLEKAVAVEALARAARGDLGTTLHDCAIELMDKAIEVGCDDDGGTAVTRTRR